MRRTSGNAIDSSSRRIFLLLVSVLSVSVFVSCARARISLRAPHNGEKNLPLSVTLNWSAESNRKLSFEVFLGTSSDVSLVATTSSMSHVLEGLSPETTYYWKVVATWGRGKTVDSGIWTFETTKRPEVPNSPEPSDKATSVATTPTLAWRCTDPDGDRLSFDIYFGSNGSMQLVETGWKRTEYTPPAELEPDTEYFWQVVAKDEKGAVTEGPVWRFRTAPAELTLEASPSTIENAGESSEEVPESEDE